VPFLTQVETPTDFTAYGNVLGRVQINRKPNLINKLAMILLLYTVLNILDDNFLIIFVCFVGINYLFNTTIYLTLKLEQLIHYFL